MAYYSRKSSELSCDDIGIMRRVIVPKRRFGYLRKAPFADLSLNRAYQMMGRAKVMQQFVNRYLHNSGTSPLYGARKEPGVLLDNFFIPLFDSEGCFLLDNNI